MQENARSLSPKQLRERGYYWDKNTLLSPQEAQIVSRLKYMNKIDIAEELGIEKSTLDSVLYHRIPSKLEEAELTVNEMRGHIKYKSSIPQPHPDATALVGCSGPDCETDVETATQNPSFDGFYTKTINKHGDSAQISNKITLQFCSLNCLNEFEELVRR